MVKSWLQSQQVTISKGPFKTSHSFLFQNYTWYTGVHLKKKKKVRWSWYPGVHNPWLDMIIPNEEGSAGQQHWPWAHLHNWATSQQQEHRSEQEWAGEHCCQGRREIRPAEKKAEGQHQEWRLQKSRGWGVWGEVRHRTTWWARCTQGLGLMCGWIEGCAEEFLGAQGQKVVLIIEAMCTTVSFIPRSPHFC